MEFEGSDLAGIEPRACSVDRGGNTQLVFIKW